ncbi:MAG: hypothetical protein ACI4JG_07665 [Acutalibacteraceae bacterium]
MKFKKKKGKLIIFYIVFFALISAVFAVLSKAVFGEDWLKITALFEIIFIGIIISFLNLFIAEINQTAQITQDLLICNNFIVGGRVVCGKIGYDKIERIELKRNPLMPYSFCLCISIANDSPFVIKDDFKNYRELWKAVCEKTGSANPNAIIDERINKHIFDK